jgi:hypothetical protein
MGNRETGHRAFRVYYAWRGEMLQHGQGKMENRNRKMAFLLAFVTDGALFGIKPIGRNGEHVVALDADTMDDRADDGAGLGRFARASRSRSRCLFRDALGVHERILARRVVLRIGAGGIPGIQKGHPL